MSTLDLCAPEALGLNMLLLCGGNSTRADNSSCSLTRSWATAGLQLAAQGWPLQVLEVLPQGTDLLALPAAAAADDSSQGPAGSVLQGSSPPSAASALPVTGAVQAVDCEGVWAQLQAAASSTAVLVRPDGHIAWVSAGSTGSGSTAGRLQGVEAQHLELLGVLKEVLCCLPQGG